MAQRFFLDADRLATLRARGLVPVSLAALRWVRIGAIFAVASVIPWNSFSQISDPPRAIDSLTVVVVPLLAPLLFVLLIGFVSTKLFFATAPERMPRSSGVRGIGENLAAHAVQLGALLAVFAWIVTNSLPAALYPILTLLRDHPLAIGNLIQRVLFWSAGLAILIGILLAAIEVLLFHFRHRQPEFGRGYQATER